MVSHPKKLDTENGQVRPAITFWEFLLGSDRSWNGIMVDNNGYLQFTKSGFSDLVAFHHYNSVPDVGLKSGAKSAGKAASKWLIYRSYKKVNGSLKLYIGKAKNALKNRYTQKEIEETAVRVIEKLGDIPDNATALGVEQAILQLNGGREATANIKNAAVKQVYVNAGLKWLGDNLPDWKEIFKF